METSPSAVMEVVPVKLILDFVSVLTITNDGDYWHRHDNGVDTYGIEGGISRRSGIDRHGAAAVIVELFSKILLAAY